MTKNIMKLVGCCLVVLGAVACSAGTNGTDGATGPAGDPGVGTPGAAGSNGSNGSGGAQGGTGAVGAKGDQGETGTQGDAGVSLCGDVQMPEWHQACGADLVGACATKTARWECHLFLTDGQSGDVTTSLSKVCADATTHVVVSTGAAQASEYPHSTVPSSSERCDTDGNCDGQLDVTTGHIALADDNGIDVKLGDSVSAVNYANTGHACQTGGTVTCVEGSIAVTGLTDATNVGNVGADCFDPATQLEHSFACVDAKGAFLNGDGDNDSSDSSCEEEGQYVAGSVSVACVAPSDAHFCAAGAP